ncbi:ABC transporter substrate-binding protein [Mesorhizobium loti]|uniref:Branched-chain amino acid ABC transporter substrate-binding protein n=1 Tax=Mesorhizobium loti R88b TaxID=935548 RepID=A0A6M7WPL7_RHILI|nr:ABC transporter substrate-binding protein [Mesorhizobium loti]QKD02559.1 branched-chain amino acid ABC transporter substrate-binding protein [Mesorhizobium loti R88b]
MQWKSSLVAVAFAGVSLAAMAGTASAAGPTCKDGTIKVGAVSTITGPADFSEVPKATQAAFDAVNAAGGINGCKIDYTIADDKADPAVAAQAARDLIDNKEAVALVGSGSLLDCAVNSATYSRKKVLSVQGLGVDAACFSSPNVAPVNVGPYTLSTAMAYYATNQLKSEKLCAFFIIIGGTQEAYKKAIENWEKISGKKIHLIDLTLPFQGDLTPYVIKARDAGCDAVLTNQVEPQVVQLIKTVDAQKITGIKWLFLAPGYTEQVASALADTKQPIYVGTEWEPFTEKSSPANAQWAADMQKAGRPLTAFSQGGYLAAQLFLKVVASIDGEVTRESVTKALHEMQPITNPLAGSPYVFGTAKVHSPMQATKVMRLEKGAWTVETPDWVVLPRAK